MYYKKEREQALKWFKQNDISCYIDEYVGLYVEVNDTSVLVSDAEVMYRSELYEEQ